MPLTKIIKIIFLLSGLFFISSCNNNNVYFQYHQVNPGAWDEDSIYSFDIEIQDSIPLYNIYINVRNTPDYPYQNLWLFISEITPAGDLKKDTIEFYLADHRGKWLGTGVGSVKEMPVLYKQDFRFDRSGIYKFQIGHGMRTKELKGITEIGMRVEQAE